MKRKKQDADSDSTARQLGELRRLIQEGLDSGPSSPLDMDEVKQEARRRWEAMNA